MNNTNKTVRSTLCILMFFVIFILSTAVVSAADSYATINGLDRSRIHSYSSDRYIIIDGIDVSAWNNLSADDWKTLKRKGIDFAFIRTSGSYYGPKDLKMFSDDSFYSHYNNAVNAGMMVGAYHYSAANNSTNARQEAKKVLSVLGNRQLDLPIVFDCECTQNRCSTLTGERRIKYARAFNNYIKEYSNHTAMYYSYLYLMNSSSFQKNKAILEAEMPVWIAQYYYQNTYKGSYNFWQHTESGKISGVSGKLDCNFWYFDRSSVITNGNGAACTVTCNSSSKKYTGGPIKPGVTVTAADGTVLTEGVDYKVNYVKNVKVGNAYAIVTGLGKYSGQAAAPFKIVKRSLEDAEITIPYNNYKYRAKEIKPAVTVTYKGILLKEGTDYTVSYSNNLNVGTAKVTVTGIGKYKSSLTKSFNIVPVDLDPEKIKVDNAYYTGKEITPKITTVYQKADYTVTYSNNKNLGTATATFTGTGNCNGNSFTKTFKITLGEPETLALSLYGHDDIKVSWSKVSGAGGYSVYYKRSSWDNYRTYDKSITDRRYVKIPNLVDGEKYLVKVVPYRMVNGKKVLGTAKVKSIYTLKKVSKPVIKKSGTRVKVSWTNIKGETGYQISKSTSRYRTNVVATYKTSTGTSKYLKATKNRKYYYKVRAYVKYGTRIVYGPWSNVTSFTRH